MSKLLIPTIITFQSDCRIQFLFHEGENIVYQAVMDEFEENRASKNLTAEILNREKVIFMRTKVDSIMIQCRAFQDECFEALQTISDKIYYNDADMRSHVVLSMVKVSAAVADVPPLPGKTAKTNAKLSTVLQLLVFMAAIDYFLVLR